MRESGALYPQEWNINGAHHALKACLIKEDKLEVMPVFEKWRKQCDDEGFNDVVISSEDFELLGEKGVSFLKKCAHKAGFAARAIMYIRPQSELIESQYSQQIREGALPGTFNSFIKKSLDHGRYLKIEEIASWYDSAFGDSFKLVFFYNEKHEAINVLEDFTRRIEVKTVNNADNYKFNKKLNSAKLETLKIVVERNSKLNALDAYQRAQILHGFIKMIEWPKNFETQPSFALTKSQLQACRTFYRDENDRLSNKYLDNAHAIDNWYKNKIQITPESFNMDMTEEISSFGQELADQLAKTLEETMH
jgi:hypothetical protein